MGAPVVAGEGGIGAYPFTGPRRSETLDIMQKKYPCHFQRNKTNGASIQQTFSTAALVLYLFARGCRKNIVHTV
jgi:hypothetical protein